MKAATQATSPRRALSRAGGIAPGGLAKALLVAAVAMVLTVGSASACVICMPYPEKTGADYVVESDTVVFARENPAAPYSYLPIEMLKGRYDGDSIPLLVDTTTARELQSDATVTVVLTQDRPDGAWRRLGLGGSEYQGVMREVAAWSVGSKTPVERAEFFAPYLTNEDDALAQLAFLEVARAPYSTIRDLRGGISREEIYSRVNDLFHVEWHALYILMLGMSDRPDDVTFVRGKLKAAMRFGMTTNLGAYATALIEMEGAEAIRLLAGEYFNGSAHSDPELVEILKALSVQGNEGRDELRATVIDAYGLLLDQRPALAGYVAEDLFDWKVSRLAPRMRAILDAGLVVDEASELAVTAYLGSLDEGQSAAALSGRISPSE